LDDSVWQLLSTIPDAVVAREPRANGSTFGPDFLVTLDDQRVLVEAKGSHAALPAFTHALAAALDTYNADVGVVVVEGLADEDVEPPVDPRLKVIAMADLRGFFSQLADG
jgi:hypothetical protein